jgi:L-fuconolactonase
VEIVDAQLHLNDLGLEAGLLAMDAVGVDAILIDEHRGYDSQGRSLPGFPLEGGSLRHVSPLGELAVTLHPDRFAYLTRCEPDDPDIAEVIAGVRAKPGRLALRILSSSKYEGPLEVRGKAFAADVRHGRYDTYFTLAAKHRTPVFLQVNGLELPGDLDTARYILERNPELSVILDHLGVALADEKGVARPHRFDQFDDVLRLAEFPNLSIKWGHAIPLSEQPYPHEDIREQLHRVVSAFGANRVMWASDWTKDLKWNSWADSLTYIRDDPGLSLDDREWILGRTVRTVLDWPAPAQSRLDR